METISIDLYSILHKSSGLKVGDKVKVTRIARNHEQGWFNTWEIDMNSSIDKEFVIMSDNKTAGFGLNDEFDNSYPCFILEKINT